MKAKLIILMVVLMLIPAGALAAGNYTLGFQRPSITASAYPTPFNYTVYSANMTNTSFIISNISYSRLDLIVNNVYKNNSAVNTITTTTVNATATQSYLIVNATNTTQLFSSGSTLTALYDIQWKYANTTNANTDPITFDPTNSQWYGNDSTPQTGYHTFTYLANGQIAGALPTGFVPADLWMSGLYTYTFTVTDSATGAPISGVVISDSGSRTNTTGTNGIASLSEPYGALVVYFTATGYQGKAISYVVDSDASEAVMLTASPTTPAINTNLIYNAQLYRLIFQNLIGTPLGGLQVTITPINLTMNASWTNALMGIPSSVNIQNGIISGTTGTDGSLGTPLITPLGYFINVTGTAQSGDYVDYSLIEYPPTQGTDIIISMPTNVTGFIHITPTPAFIVYNIYNQTINSTAEKLSVNFNDPTGITNLTIVTVSNQSGHILNQTVYTGAAAGNVVNNFTYIQGVTSPAGDELNFGFCSYVPTAGGWNNISQPLSFSSGSSLTGNATYDGWAAIILIILISSAFTASTVYIGTIGVGLMGLFFYATVKWFTPGIQGTVFITMCVFWICIGMIGFIMKKSRSPF